MRVKEYKPKYELIELIMDAEDLKMPIPIGKMKFKKVVELYGDYYICSIYDFNDTHTTSLIIQEKEYTGQVYKQHNEPSDGKDFKNGYKIVIEE